MPDSTESPLRLRHDPKKDGPEPPPPERGSGHGIAPEEEEDHEEIYGSALNGDP
jgi:hypothetical protein